MLIRTMLVCFSLGAMLTAQNRDHEVPLKNWPAPLSWQPSPEAATPAGSLVFVAMTPCRVVDTRASSGFPSGFGQPSMMSGTRRDFALQSSSTCSIPAIAQAYSTIVTLVPPGPVGYLIVWPTGQPQPNVVTLDDLPGDIRQTGAIIPAGTPNGSISAITNGTTDLVIDINGYYAPSTGVTLAQGTLSAPSLSFSGDAGTGMYSSGTGVLNLAVGGQIAMSIGGSNDNTALGQTALASNTTGSLNTAVGIQALQMNTSGTSNIAVGGGALVNNTSGNQNTAVGYAALITSTTVDDNTADGYAALGANSTGSQNTASGSQAMRQNTTGSDNTATGYHALYWNSVGVENTASGSQALFNTTGSSNTASGYQALYNNTSGGSNTAMGRQALFANHSGSSNTGIGFVALQNATGTNNTAVGASAGSTINTGSNNIDIGNAGDPTDGTSANSGVIRIGTSGTQTSFFAAGISGVTAPSGVEVFIGTGGQLGTVQSSRRYKENIQDMSDASSGLLRLRPVTYRYQQPYPDGSRPIDYGLIAEEVADVYPDLVVKGDDGQVQTVQYHKLVPMLVNELQKEREAAQSLQAQLSTVQKALETLMAGQAQPAVAPVR